MGSRAWQADLETRERQVSLVLQDFQACGDRKESRARKGSWASQA